MRKLIQVMNGLQWLQKWYLSQCDGDWEHTFGVHIETMDNPGWLVRIHLEDTELEEKPFSPVEVKRSDDDWYQCKVDSFQTPYVVQKNVFQAFCGPLNLTDVVSIFRTWASQDQT